MDESARTSFRKALDRNFCVIAGAGSGKTTAIVERVRELAVRDLNALRRLVVVTYTNSAAIEFKSRAKQLLLDTVAEADALIYLRALEQAYFGTIHGFCLNLIREFRSRLWLPDDFRVPTETERDLLWEAFVTDSPELGQLVQHRVGQSLLRVSTLNDLLTLAKRFRPSKLLTPPARKMPLPDPANFRKVSVPKNAQKSKQRLVEAVDAFVERLSKNSGFSPVPRRETAAKALKEVFNEQMAPLVAWLEEASEWFADQLARRFRERCIQAGILTYADQIDTCIEILRQPELLDQVRRREPIVIVDEAQDTDARMFQVFIEITRPLGETFGSWPGTGKPPISGRFCLVGDPRQTIFERATTNRFAQLSEQLDSGHEKVRFNVTYRCAQEVVQRLNDLFEAHAVENVSLGDLVARPGAPAGFVGRLPFATEQPIDTEDELEPLVPECETVAKWLAQRSPVGLGINSWSDIAIIAPRHDWLTIAGEALKKYGVPFSFFRPKTSRSGIAAFAWPVSLIYTLLRPWDKFERYGVLRELFGVSDTDLLRARKGVGEPAKILADAQELLERARIDLVLKKPRSLLYFVERLLERFRLRDRLIAIGEEFNGLDQLRWEAAKADERGSTLEQWLEELLVLLQDFAQPSKAPAKGVELITTYSAKGLEWDWVIPIGLRKKFSYRSERYPRIEAGEETRVIWSNLSRRAARDEEAAKAELKRLLYVMLTRAKVGLILPTPQGAYRPGRQGTAFNEVVPDDHIDLPLADDAVPESEPVRRPVRRPVLRPVLRSFSEGESFSEGGSSSEGGSLGQGGRQKPREEDRSSGTSVTLSDAAGPQPPRLIRPHQLADDSPVLHLQFAEVAGSYDYGKWWHSWIETFPWAGEPERWQNYAGTAFPPNSYRERATKEIAALLGNTDLRRLCENALWFQAEFPFSWPKTTQDWYEGVIDLLIGRTDGTLYIVDWKTNQAALDESPDQLADHLRLQYLPQLESYREALQTMMDNRAIEIGIYSTVLGRFV